MGCGIVTWKNSGYCTNGTGQAGSQKMYIFPGRLMRAAPYRTQTYGRKTVISHHHKGKPEIQQITLLECGQGVAGRTECRYDTGDLPADGEIVRRRLSE